MHATARVPSDLAAPIPATKWSAATVASGIAAAAAAATRAPGLRGYHASSLHGYPGGRPYYLHQLATS